MAKKNEQTGLKAKKQQTRSIKAGRQQVQKGERASTPNRTEVRRMTIHRQGYNK